MSTETRQILAACQKARNKEAEANFTRRGYWFVKGDKRVFISESVSVSALEKVADKELSESKGWDYWIDYCHGRDVFGNPAWANIDQTDRFI